MQEQLQRASRHVVGRAYFSKSTFVEGFHKMGFALVSRFRNDAVLLYPTLQKPTGNKGRIDMTNPDKSKVEKIEIDNGELYTLLAWWGEGWKRQHMENKM